MHRKQNFEILGFKSDAAVLIFTFLFLSAPLFSLFVTSLFFFISLLVVGGFILVGKAFRTLGGGEWNKIFMESFWSMLREVLPFLQCP